MTEPRPEDRFGETADVALPDPSALPTGAGATTGAPLAPDSLLSDPTEVAGVTADGEEARSPEVSQENADRFIGRVLANRYKILHRIGIGGFGAVFEAEDAKIRKRVAVKVLTRDLSSDSAMLTRFRFEAESASQVGHENIIDITDFDRTTDGHYFLVMEYLDGIDLGSLIRSGERLPLARILGIMIQVCRALHAAHDKGIVHRDLKPGNIYLCGRAGQGDFVKLLDFGISKFLEADETSARLTKTGQIIGTPLYMSPEQARGDEQLDHRVDIYSLGVIMYELITGQPPFTAVNYLGIIAQHASDPPVPPSKVRPDLEVPLQVEVIILKAMAKKPADRFSTMAEMEAALLHALTTVDPGAAVSYTSTAVPPSLLTAPTGLSQRRLTSARSVPLWAVLGAAALFGITVAVFAGWPRREGASNAPPPGAAAAVAVVLDAGVPQRVVEQPKQVTTSDELTKVTLEVDSLPSGATVVDPSGIELGQTPFALRVDRSDVPLRLTFRRPGYRDATLTVVPREPRRVSLALKRRPRGSGLPDDPKGWEEH